MKASGQSSLLMDGQVIDVAAQKTRSELLRDHLKEHRSHLNRVSLDLGESKPPGLPTDERLAAVRTGAENPGVVAFYFQYGRYLLMSSSRWPGRLPANLQGIWNGHMWAPGRPTTT